MGRVIIFLVAEDWYFLSHRMAWAKAEIARGAHVILAARISDGRDALEAAGIEVVDLPWRRGGGLTLADLITLKRLIQLYRAHPHAVLHHVALKPIFFGTFAARWARADRIINAVAGLGFTFTATSFNARILRALMAVIGRVLLAGPNITLLFQNRDDRARFAALIGRDPLTCPLIEGAGVDLDRFAPTPEPQDDEVIFVLPARMLRIKGVEVAIAAMKLARARGAKAKLVLAGRLDPGNPSALNPGQLSPEALGAGVTWLGPVADMAALWRKAHVGLLPSLGGEGVPMALLEAASAGRALIGTDVPGIRDLVIQGRTGHLVPPGDVEALATAIQDLTGDGGARRHLGQAARAHVVARFGRDRIISQVLGLHDRPQT